MVYASKFKIKSFLLCLAVTTLSPLLWAQGEDGSTAEVSVAALFVPKFEESRLVSTIVRPMSDADEDTEGIQVRITTDPSIADIKIGSRSFDSNSSPLEIESLKAGRYRLTVSKDGYAPFDYSFDIRDGYQY